MRELHYVGEKYKVIESFANHEGYYFKIGDILQIVDVESEPLVYILRDENNNDVWMLPGGFVWLDLCNS